MESTLTQNCALYYAQHKTSKRRATLFKKFRAAARNQGAEVRHQLTFGDLFIVPRLHKDNGR
jgi:alpha-ketoglutarate-dependent taurine dioxygenase